VRDGNLGVGRSFKKQETTTTGTAFHSQSRQGGRQYQNLGVFWCQSNNNARNVPLFGVFLVREKSPINNVQGAELLLSGVVQKNIGLNEKDQE